MKRLVTVGWVFCLIDFAVSPSHVPTHSIFKGPTEAAGDPHLADTECWEVRSSNVMVPGLAMGLSSCHVSLSRDSV